MTPLTKLPTRGQLLRQLGDAIVAAQQDGTEVAVLVVDLDHLKRVNDALGLPAGDELLVRIAERACAPGSALPTWSPGWAATSSRSCCRVSSRRSPSRHAWTCCSRTC